MTVPDTSNRGQEDFFLLRFGRAHSIAAGVMGLVVYILATWEADSIEEPELAS